jgi:photosystem II stability/assembly factor-like uncharacterized protein
MTWAVWRLPPGDGMITNVSCPTPNSCVVATIADNPPVVGGVELEPQSGADEFFPTNVISTSDAGRSWSTLTYPPGPSNVYYQMQSVDCPDRAHCYFVGARTTLVPYSHGQGTYVQSDTVGVIMARLGDAPGLTTQLSSPALWPATLSCGDSTHCLTLSGSGIGPSTVLATSDGGQKWGQTPAVGISNDLGAQQVDCVSASTCIAIIEPLSGSNVAVTYDAGKHWTVETKAVALISVSCTTDQKCIALEPYWHPSAHVSDDASSVRPVRNFKG